jgi:ABC-2 type transport system ATP-binding protein
MESIVKVDELVKKYGELTAVNGISFEVQEGEIFGMVGPNGAGKTTTIEILEGLRKPDSGSVRVLGVDPQDHGRFLREHTGIQLQQSILPDRMRVWEALDLYSSFYPDPVDWEKLLVELGLAEKRNTAFTKLSGGQKQRLFVALALLPNPDLVFLDELTTGLDPQARRVIWNLVRDIRDQGTTVFLTTHFMDEAENLCDRVAILVCGEVVALDTPAALIRDLGAEERVIFDLDGVLPDSFSGAFSSTIQIEEKGKRVVIFGKNDDEVPLVSEVVKVLTEKGIPFHDLRTEQLDLEDVFLELTGREMKDEG